MHQEGDNLLAQEHLLAQTRLWEVWIRLWESRSITLTEPQFHYFLIV